ncbi:hypothetical protein BDAP_001380 [Binucleata daphniae]
MKRIRNKKIEPLQKHPVFLYSKLDSNKLQEHLQITLHTGMEEEEKEELHLKDALTNQLCNIPLPNVEVLNESDVDEIKETVNTTKQKPIASIYKKPKEYIKYSEDVSNKYILSHEDYEYINNTGISIEDYMCAVNKINEENEKFVGNKENLAANLQNIDKNLLKYLQERLLLLYDDKDFNSYACFRKRIIKTARKSRKLELNCIEKLRKLWNEINMIKKLYDLSVTKFKNEIKMFETNNEILRNGIKILQKIGKKRKTRIINKIIGKDKKEKEELFYEKYGDEVFKDAWRLNQLKCLIQQNKLNEKDANEEAKFLYEFVKKEKARKSE